MSLSVEQLADNAVEALCEHFGPDTVAVAKHGADFSKVYYRGARIATIRMGDEEVVVESARLRWKDGDGVVTFWHPTEDPGLESFVLNLILGEAVRWKTVLDAEAVEDVAVLDTLTAEQALEIINRHKHRGGEWVLEATRPASILCLSLLEVIAIGREYQRREQAGEEVGQ